MEVRLVDAVNVRRQVTKEQQGNYDVWTRITVSPASVQFAHVAEIVKELLLGC